MSKTHVHTILASAGELILKTELEGIAEAPVIVFCNGSQNGAKSSQKACHPAVATGAAEPQNGGRDSPGEHKVGPRSRRQTEHEAGNRKPLSMALTSKTAHNGIHADGCKEVTPANCDLVYPDAIEKKGHGLAHTERQHHDS